MTKKDPTIQEMIEDFKQYIGHTVANTIKESEERIKSELGTQIQNAKKDLQIVIGDGENDMLLFKAGGFKVAMGSAAPVLKAEADLIIGDVKDDGLAEYLESLI